MLSAAACAVVRANIGDMGGSNDNHTPGRVFLLCLRVRIHLRVLAETKAEVRLMFVVNRCVCVCVCEIYSVFFPSNLSSG